MLSPQASTPDTGEAGAGAAGRVIELAQVGLALAVCAADGRVTGGSPSGQALLARMGMVVATLPAPLPAGLWQLIAKAEVGAAVQWRSERDGTLLLGCTRYRLGAEAFLLVMSEISEKQNALAQRLHRQRLESLGRLVASTAHDLRAPLASIVFNGDILTSRLDELSRERLLESLADMNTAATRLRATVDNLLDYVRIGPPAPCEVSIKEVMTRVQSLLRPYVRAGCHRLTLALSDQVDSIIGNPIAVQQILLNLVLNSIESADGPVTVTVSSGLEAQMLRILVDDDGPGIRPELRLQVFDPFFTTKLDGTGIGLTSARESARTLGGDVHLVRSSPGAAFAVLLPPSDSGRAS